MGETSNSRLEETAQTKSWNKLIGMQKELDNYDSISNKSTKEARKARDLHDEFLTLYGKHLQKYGDNKRSSGKGPLEIPKLEEIRYWSNKD